MRSGHPFARSQKARVSGLAAQRDCAANPRNPNHPPARISRGPATTDEIAGLHIEVVPVDADDTDELTQALWGKVMRSLGGGIYRR